MLDLHLFMNVFEIYKVLVVLWNFYAPTYYGKSSSFVCFSPSLLLFYVAFSN